MATQTTAAAAPSTVRAALNGATLSRDATTRASIATALDWRLTAIRCARNADASGAAYTADWLRSTAGSAKLLAPNLDAAVAAAIASDDADVLADADDALSDAIEVVNTRRGCGWYDKAGRLHARPYPYVKASDTFRPWEGVVAA